MLISKKLNLIFVHIYKNAGTSITRALLPLMVNRGMWLTYRLSRRIGVKLNSDPMPFSMHIKANEIIDLIGCDEYEKYFSFAIVRNPWDWQVSLYNYMLRNVSHPQYVLVKNMGTFDNYIKWRCKEEVRLQKDFVYSEDGRLLVNYVGRYENLETDFAYVCSHAGVSVSLPRLNVSNNRPYRQFYTDETVELVRNAFSSDISTFGYDF